MTVPTSSEELHTCQMREAAYRAILDRLSQNFGYDRPTVQGVSRSVESAESERQFWQLQVDAAKCR